MQEITYSKKITDLLDYDKQHLWHPYTSMDNPQFVLPVKRADGCTIYIDSQSPNELALVDGMSSWWSVIHGYNNKELNQAAIDQISKTSHVMFGGFTHEPAVNLTKKLIQLVDHKEIKHCFLADSGSVAVEVAMKMALQHKISISPNSEVKNMKFLTIRNGYHGDTMGAMSVCDPVNSMHWIYKGYFNNNIFFDAPPTISVLPTSQLYKKHFNVLQNLVAYDGTYIKDLEITLKEHLDDIVGLIVEPIVQGAGGMRLYHPKYLIEMRKLCNKYQKLLILDEIATGFGRTGQIFAFKHCQVYQDEIEILKEEQVDVYPDIMCVGKALTGGYMTLSAVLACDNVVKGLSSQHSPTKGYFMHGPTFMGNPLACSVANKSLEIILRNNWKEQVEKIEKQLFDELYLELNNNTDLVGPVVKRIAVLGAIGIVELEKYVDLTWLQQNFINEGVNIRPFGRLIYIMPPYVITSEELRKLTNAIVKVLKLCA